MADFRNISDFKKSKTSKYPYQDPTYLSFVILFDFNDRANSPLLSGAAEDFLINSLDAKDTENLSKSEQNNSSGSPSNDDDNTNTITGGGNYYSEKLIALIKFKKALATINNDLPWYWQSLSGLDALQKWNPEQPYFGAEDATLTIGTLESLNLPIAGLMSLYRKAVFDERKWNWVIPANLRKFRMYVYVTEVRSIKNLTSPQLNGVDFEDFPRNIKPSIGIDNANDGISGQNSRPYFMFGVKYCEFDLTSGVTPFADLQKNPTESAANEIAINYEQLVKIETRALNGIVQDIDSSNISPSGEAENQTIENLEDYADDRFNKKVNELKDRSVQDLKRLSQQKQNELAQAALDATVNRIPTIDNIYQNFVQSVDDATDVTQQSRNIGANIKENIFDNSSEAEGQNIQDALDRAAVNSLGNVFD